MQQALSRDMVRLIGKRQETCFLVLGFNGLLHLSEDRSFVAKIMGFMLR